MQKPSQQQLFTEWDIVIIGAGRVATRWNSAVWGADSNQAERHKHAASLRVKWASVLEAGGREREREYCESY